MKRFLFPLLLLFVCPSVADAYKFASGSYTGNITDNRTIDISDTTSPSVTDFQPNFVWIKCDSTDASAWSTSAMPADTSLVPTSTTTGGVADHIQSFVSNGFTIGANARVNASGVTCWYLALGTDANNDLAVGTYTGNNSASRAITISPSFQPEFVMVQTSNTSSAHGVFRTAAHSGDASCTMPSGGSFTCTNTNMVEGFNADGFQVGNAGQTNANLLEYYYLAIKASSGNTFAGTFAGDATDNRQITAPGFQPQWMIIKGNSTAASPRSRFKDHSGDDSIAMSGIASAADQIQQFLSNGFEVGTASGVNENLVTMYYYVMKAQAAATGIQTQTIIVE